MTRENQAYRGLKEIREIPEVRARREKEDYRACKGQPEPRDQKAMTERTAGAL